MGMRWRGGRYPGRPLKKRRIMSDFGSKKFICPTSENKNLESVIFFDELEALKLVDYMNLSQIEAGEKMNISRGTIWRLIENGRKKIIDAIINGKTIIIKPK
jgi:predicted DNA-binding protein (UPF0251 family)